MQDFLQLPDDRKQAAYDQVAQRMGIPSSYVEKDLWVCWVLGVLFSEVDLAPHVTFRGGTSLTKAFGIIDRFSEDIDLSLSREWLGITPDTDPARASTTSQAERRQKALRVLAREKIQTVIEPLLKKALRSVNLSGDDWRIELNDDENALDRARDPYCVFLYYPCLTGAIHTEYIRPRVKIEFSAKAEGTPDEDALVQPFVADHFPEAFLEMPISLRVVSPVRTFFEKAFIIHEENTAPESRQRKPRLARHYYDLYRLIQTGYAHMDNMLFQQVCEHRQVYFKQSWVDYGSMVPKDLCIIPQTDRMRGIWQSDYAMMSTMIYGNYPELNVVMKRISGFLSHGLDSS